MVNKLPFDDPDGRYAQIGSTTMRAKGTTRAVYESQQTPQGDFPIFNGVRS